MYVSLEKELAWAIAINRRAAFETSYGLQRYTNESQPILDTLM